MAGETPETDRPTITPARQRTAGLPAELRETVAVHAANREEKGMRKLLLACLLTTAVPAKAQEPDRMLLEAGIVGGNSIACPATVRAPPPGPAAEGLTRPFLNFASDLAQAVRGGRQFRRRQRAAGRPRAPPATGGRCRARSRRPWRPCADGHRGGTARESGHAGVDFGVTLNRASSETVSVGYATADGSAKAGED